MPQQLGCNFPPQNAVRVEREATAVTVNRYAMDSSFLYRSENLRIYSYNRKKSQLHHATFGLLQENGPIESDTVESLERNTNVGGLWESVQLDSRERNDKNSEFESLKIALQFHMLAL